jgi:hypothetical protein
MRLYLAGPMRGYPEFNYPAFHKMAAELRAQGHFVFNPAEATDHTDGDPADYMLVDLAWIIAHAQGIAMLPGWEKSKGAKVEHALAECLGLEIMYLDQ